MKSRISKLGAARHPQFARRALLSEPLESRNLLAADMTMSWQNAVDCNDVNQDGAVTALDMLAVVRTLNSRGAHALPERASGEPQVGPAANPMLVDANGDGWVTARDAQQVLSAIEAQGEGETVRVRLEVVDIDGNVVDTVQVGQQFELRTYIQDIRDIDDPTGVFAAYLDLTYDETLVSFESTADITFGDAYPNGKNAITSVAGLIDEIGAFASGTSLGGEEQLLFSVAMEADSAGQASFGTDAADVLPAGEVLFFGLDDLVDPADIEFGSFTLTIQAPEAVSDTITVDSW